MSRDDVVRARYEDTATVAGYASSYEDRGPSARYFRSRLHVVEKSLRLCPSGVLLDVGCGPGMFVRHQLDTRPGEFSITACDRSPAMIDAVAGRVGDSADVRCTVARIEDLPYPDESFDVVVAMGVLEYVGLDRALREVARVVRPGGLVIATMLNPLSPYRLFRVVCVLARAAPAGPPRAPGGRPSETAARSVPVGNPGAAAGADLPDAAWRRLAARGRGPL